MGLTVINPNLMPLGLFISHFLERYNSPFPPLPTPPLGLFKIMWNENNYSFNANHSNNCP